MRSSIERQNPNIPNGIYKFHHFPNSKYGESTNYNQINVNLTYTMLIRQNVFEFNTKSSHYLLDHMLCNNLDIVTAWHGINVGFSDHSLSHVSLKIGHHSNTTNTCNLITYRKIKGLDVEAFGEGMRLQSWSELDKCNDFDEAVGKFEKFVMPQRTRKVSKSALHGSLNRFFGLMKYRDKMKNTSKLSN